MKRRWEKLIFSNFIVASFAEAWIEKLWTALPLYWFPVASFAEAWIEKSNMICACDRTISSPPSRRRGLKKNIWNNITNNKKSPPSRRRGLKIKLDPTNTQLLAQVASFAEAWIENVMDEYSATVNERRLLRGGVD